MRLIHIPILAVLLCACGNTVAGGGTESSAPADSASVMDRPDFCADSAYAFVRTQVEMGPRVPGTDAHLQCRDFIVKRMKLYGADTVFLQSADVRAFDGKTLPMHNIVARFNTSAPSRILIAAHYDTRPWADEDSDPSVRNKAIDGANDGASGVAVALEIARNLASATPATGVDFLLTDVEDYGSHSEDPAGESSWALGAQYFAANSPYAPADRPAFGILLDMVGGRGARFYREYFSENAAQWVNTKVWKAAREEGVSRFIDEQRGAVTDDHIFITRAGIPCIDIIECAHPQTGSFPPYWHTMDDNLSAIDPATLSDVGRTLMRVIFTEKPR